MKTVSNKQRYELVMKTLHNLRQDLKWCRLTNSNACEGLNISEIVYYINYYSERAQILRNQN